MRIIIENIAFEIDEEYVATIEEKKWHARKFGNGKYYLVHNYMDSGKVKALLFHRLVTCAPHGLDVDHIDGNTLDNRKCNLRICNRSQNIWNSGKRKNNTSGFKGAFYSKEQNKWFSKIGANNKVIFLGYFNTREEAHAAYAEAAKKYHGEFANF